VYSALDLDTVIEASQQLSSKLNYSDLLTSLMDLTMSNTCATKGVLLLTEEYCEEGVEMGSKSADSDEGKPKQLFLKAKAECPLVRLYAHHHHLPRKLPRSSPPLTGVAVVAMDASGRGGGQGAQRSVQGRERARAQPSPQLLLANQECARPL
jgi:hypothetical protein